MAIACQIYIVTVKQIFAHKTRGIPTCQRVCGKDEHLHFLNRESPMSRIGKVSVLLVVAVCLVACIMIGQSLSQPIVAQGPGGTPNATHSVVMTDGTHLIVTDNKTDTLYFYSIEKDAPIGSDLKLRGKLDLAQVGKDVISPVVMFKKEK